MKKILFIILPMFVYAFDIQTIDNTNDTSEDNIADNLSKYIQAGDGKKIYKPVTKIIRPTINVKRATVNIVKVFDEKKSEQQKYKQLKKQVKKEDIKKQFAKSDELKIEKVKNEDIRVDKEAVVFFNNLNNDGSNPVDMEK